MLQKSIAEEVTKRVHSEKDLKMGDKKLSNILFGKSTTEDLKSLDEETFLSVFEGVPQFEMKKIDLELGILDIVVEKTQIFDSKGESRRMIKKVMRLVLIKKKLLKIFNYLKMI